MNLFLGDGDMCEGLRSCPKANLADRMGAPETMPSRRNLSSATSLEVWSSLAHIIFFPVIRSTERHRHGARALVLGGHPLQNEAVKRGSHCDWLCPPVRNISHLFHIIGGTDLVGCCESISLLSLQCQWWKSNKLRMRPVSGNVSEVEM